MHSAYIDFRFSRNALLLVNERSPMLAQSVFAAAHAWNTSKQAGERVAVALPLMALLEQPAKGHTPLAQPGECLSLLRVFAEEDVLQAFAESSAVAQMVSSGLTRRPRMRSVDTDEIDGYAAYVRERKSERKTAAAIARDERRLARRAAARGEDRDSHTVVMSRMKKLNGQLRAPGSRGTVFVPARSTSTGQGFSLTIKRLSSETEAQGLAGSYGLSAAEQPIFLPEV